ncbi:MAG: EAL domain-containing protein [Hyphomicrobiales bacterium]|nr:EAL domain-containing protein [Hyphomicrobiales bacterium]
MSLFDRNTVSPRSSNRRWDAPRVDFARVWKVVYPVGGHVQRLYNIERNAALAAFSQIFVAEAVYLYCRDYLDAANMHAWFVCVLASGALLALLPARGSARRTQTIRDEDIRYFLMMTLLGCLPWSAMGVLATSSLPAHLQIFPIGAMATVTLGATMMIAAAPILAMTAVWTIFAPMAVYYALNGGAGLDVAGWLAFFCLLLNFYCFFFGVAVQASEKSKRRQAEHLIALERAKHRIEAQALSDAVTGLANRRAFHQRAESILSQPCEAEKSYALYLVDLDHFKSVNDIYGHTVGDRYLQAVASHMQVVCGADAFVARIGGDEFVALTIQPLDAQSIANLGERLLERLSRPTFIEGHDVGAGCTITVAQAWPDETDASGMLTRADRMLRVMKTQQRGALRIFNEKDRAELAARGAEARLLETGLADGDIGALYLPQINLQTGAYHSFDATFQWRKPDGSTCGFARFSALAEEFGFMDQALNATFHAIARDVLRIRARDAILPRLSCNIHALRLRQPEKVIAHIAEFAMVCGGEENLTLEIHEEALVGRGAERIPQILRSFADKGVQLSLDKFGEGLGAIRHLKTLPFSQIKIARRLVEAASKNDSDRVLVRSLVQTAKARGMSVVACGVASEAQASMLRELGVDYAQGPLFGAAMDFEAMIEAFAPEPAVRNASA